MKLCKKCVLPETYPNIKFDEDGVCNYCNEFIQENQRNKLINNEEELIKYLEKYRIPGNKYDVLVPVSGGVDSCSALVSIVDKYKLKPLVFHNDHGYEDEIASKNIKKICAKLNVDLIIWQRDLEFIKKIWKSMHHIKGTTCLMCGTMLYMNVVELASKFDIPLVINGYSKGQASIANNMQNTRALLGEVIKAMEKSGDLESINELQNKLKLRDNHVFFDNRQDIEGSINPGKILIIPFYIFKFQKTDQELAKANLIQRFNWEPMKTSYPKQKTASCEMAWLNINMDLKKMDYSYYHEEYSQLIRENEMNREEALRYLEFNPPDGVLERLASEIGSDGFCCAEKECLIAFKEK